MYLRRIEQRILSDLPNALASRLPDMSKDEIYLIAGEVLTLFFFSGPFHNKQRLPAIYFKAPLEQRLEWLAGMLDGDGWKQSNVKQKGKTGITYGLTQVRFQLLKDIRLLAKSCGFDVSPILSRQQVTALSQEEMYIFFLSGPQLMALQPYIAVKSKLLTAAEGNTLNSLHGDRRRTRRTVNFTWVEGRNMAFKNICIEGGYFELADGLIVRDSSNNQTQQEDID